MQKRTEAEVIINGKRYKIAGIEEEEYLQKIASYLNGKYATIREMQGYRNMDADMKQALILINTADDFLKEKQQNAEKKKELELRDTDIFNLKHDLLEEENKIRELEEQIRTLQAAQMEYQKKIVRLETELGNARKGR